MPTSIEQAILDTLRQIAGQLRAMTTILADIQQRQAFQAQRADEVLTP